MIQYSRSQIIQFASCSYIDSSEYNYSSSSIMVVVLTGSTRSRGRGRRGHHCQGSGRAAPVPTSRSLMTLLRYFHINTVTTAHVVYSAYRRYFLPATHSICAM